MIMISSKKGSKVSRVKVSVRCRPAFQDEIEFAKGEFFSIVEVKKEEPHLSKLGQISLMTMSGKTRDFYFDYAFGEDTTQDQVYDRLARPVVNEVLKGCNGTIFAYGQTGTGKTYTMGILDFVNNEHSGLIPRATHQIFEHIQKESNADINVAISFLQLYRETIQDLLSPANNTAGGNEENLAIREDPVRGFYVEGLQEFAVRSYGEAEALINLGLENRAIAPTLMNATSSRSHIVLTISIEQKIYGEGTNYTKTLRSKLLMVDLAGSERVRRTVSKGTRLSEAKSINTSLSALGNVIAALAEQNATHIPYRDSKLTRLLQDSLGGTASTALIATIGPAAVNYGETLSTLLFAQRCMAVKITPIPHEEVDYAEMCAKLQAQINSMEGTMTEKLLAQQEMYETTIRTLNQQLEEERLRSQQQEYQATMMQHNQGQANAEEDFNQELYQVLSYLEKADHEEGELIESSWLRKPAGWSSSKLSAEQKQDLPNGQLVTLLAYCFELIKYLSNELSMIIDKNIQRDEEVKHDLELQFEVESENEKLREWERGNMFRNDPRHIRLLEEGVVEEEQPKIGSHLAPLSKLEALTRVEGQFRSNNLPISQFDRETILPSSIAAVTLKSSLLDSFYQYESIQDIALSLINIRSYMSKTIHSLHTVLERKDHHYHHVKAELTNQLVEKRKREEEVINWSYILKYLLASASKLRKELNQEKRIQSKIASMQKSSSIKNRAEQSKDLLPLSVAETKLEDMSMQSDFDKVSLNESIIYRLENTILSQVRQSSSATGSGGNAKNGNSNDRNFVPFGGNSARNPISNQSKSQVQSQQRIAPNQRPSTSSAPSNEDETASMTSDAPRGGGPPQPLTASNGLNQSYPIRRSTANDEALERVKLRLQVTKEELKNDHGPHPPKQHPSLVAQYSPPSSNPTTAQRNQSITSVQSDQSQGSSMSKLFNPNTGHHHPQDFQTPYDYSITATPSINSYKSNTPNTINPRRSSVEVAEEEPIEYDEERYSIDDSEYSLTSTTRSFRSAATPNSIPMPHYRKSKKKEPLRAQQPPLQFEEEEEEPTQPIQPGNSFAYQQQRQPIQPSPVDISHISTNGKGPRQQGGRNTLSRGSSVNDSNGTTIAAPSVFAQEIVRNLGVQGSQALSVMSVIDRVKNITPDQLAILDEETRNQIVTIRKDLGIDEYILSNQQRRMNAEVNHIERTRSSSNPRNRVAQQPAAPLSESQRSNVGNSSRPTSASRSVRSTTPNLRSSIATEFASHADATHRQRPPSRERNSVGAPSPPSSSQYANPLNNSRTATGRTTNSQSPIKPRLNRPSRREQDADFDDDNEEEEEEGFSQIDLMYRK